MIIQTAWGIRGFGIAGILGAVVFIFGDLLYNHVPGSKQSPAEKMGRLPDTRLITAGTLGFIGCWLYTLSSFHLYLVFRPLGELFGQLVLVTFGAVMIGYGIGHTAFFSIASGAQAAVKLGSNAEEGGKLGNRFFQKLVIITYIPTAFTSVLMVYGTISGRSLYPRWMVIFLPIVIYLLKIPVTRLLRGRAREIVNDAYDNFTLLVFFLVSTLVLWNSLAL